VERKKEGRSWGPQDLFEEVKKKILTKGIFFSLFFSPQKGRKEGRKVGSPPLV